MLVDSFCDDPQAHCAAQGDAVWDVGRLGLECLVGDAQPTTTALGPCGDAVVMIVGQTPTVMTHKPTARLGETPS